MHFSGSEQRVLPTMWLMCPQLRSWRLTQRNRTSMMTREIVPSTNCPSLTMRISPWPSLALWRFDGLFLYLRNFKHLLYRLTIWSGFQSGAENSKKTLEPCTSGTTSSLTPSLSQKLGRRHPLQELCLLSFLLWSPFSWLANKLYVV